MSVQLRRLDAQETRRSFDTDYQYEELLRRCEPGAVYEITVGRFQRPGSVRWKLERAAERMELSLRCSLHPRHLPSVVRFSVLREENHDDDD